MMFLLHSSVYSHKQPCVEHGLGYYIACAHKNGYSDVRYLLKV